MAVASAGQLTVSAPGTLVRATANKPDPTAHVSCHGVLFQAHPDNTGIVYVGGPNLNKTTGVGLYGRLVVPTTNLLPTFSIALTIAPNGLALEQFWVDADDADDIVLCSYLYT